MKIDNLPKIGGNAANVKLCNEYREKIIKSELPQNFKWLYDGASLEGFINWLKAFDDDGNFIFRVIDRGAINAETAARVYELELAKTTLFKTCRRYKQTPNLKYD